MDESRLNGKMPGPPFPRPIAPGSFDARPDLRSFGEPIKRMRSIEIRECGEPLVDLREACPAVRLQPGCLPLLRLTVAHMVAAAQTLLPDGYTLLVHGCFRTAAMQQSIRDMLGEKLRTEHPDWTRPTLARMLNRMVAPLDPLAPAPHTTGAAVDVGLNDPDGQPVRFSPGEDWWVHAPTYSPGLDDECRRSRLMLIAAMESAGLTNYVGEWWHWSFGDQGWALRVGSPFAYYEAVSVPGAESLKVPAPDETAKQY